MRVRKLTAEGDYSFGRGQADFYRDSPDAVAQAVKTRLALLTGEWFLDTQEGTPYSERILGKSNAQERDLAIRERILGTEGVTEIVSYSSASSEVDRSFSVTVTINTLYGQTTVTTTL